MATYMISFRIASDSDHSSRWASTVAAIRREAIGGAYWEETTSLVVLKSDKVADSLASSIFIGSEFNSTKDTLLVVNTANSTYATRGKVEYPATLDGLFTQQNALRTILG
tara:strand:+ start:108 stop:437 length:330 start_codon:yes stop_codon:yes gene_type:complete